MRDILRFGLISSFSIGTFIICLTFGLHLRDYLYILFSYSQAFPYIWQIPAVTYSLCVPPVGYCSRGDNFQNCERRSSYFKNDIKTGGRHNPWFPSNTAAQALLFRKQGRQLCKHDKTKQAGISADVSKCDKQGARNSVFTGVQSLLVRLSTLWLSRAFR